jgi:hypothetical protein
MELTGFDIVQIIDKLKGGLYYREREQAILSEIKSRVVETVDANENADALLTDLELRAEIYTEVARQARWLSSGRLDNRNNIRRQG